MTSQSEVGENVPRRRAKYSVVVDLFINMLSLHFEMTFWCHEVKLRGHGRVIHTQWNSWKRYTWLTNSCFVYAAALKWHNSYRLWQEVDKNPTSKRTQQYYWYPQLVLLTWSSLVQVLLSDRTYPCIRNTAGIFLSSV